MELWKGRGVVHERWHFRDITFKDLTSKDISAHWLPLLVGPLARRTGGHAFGSLANRGADYKGHLAKLHWQWLQVHVTCAASSMWSLWR